MTPSHDSRDWPPPRQGWYAVMVLMVAYLFSYVDRQILSMLVGPIKADLGLTDTEVSWLHGLAFALCYTVLGVWPVGKWADTGHRRNVIAAGIALWSVMTVLCGRASTFATLFLARAGVGVGEAALTPTAYSMLADLFPPEKRGRAIGLFGMGVPFGIGVAIMVTGLVVATVASGDSVSLPLVGEVRAWQAAFFIVGPPGLLVALWTLTIREPIRRDHVAGASVRFADACAHLIEHRRFYGSLTFGVSLLTLIFNGAAFWTPAFLTRVHGYAPFDIAMTFGPLMFVFGSAGMFAGGIIADRLRSRGHLDAEVRVAKWSAIALGPITALAFQMPTATGMLALLGPVLFFSSLPFAPASASLQIATPNRFRARVSAMYLLVVNLTGIGFGSTAAALLTDQVFKDENRVGDSITLLALVASPLAAITLAYAARAYREMQAR